MSKNVAIVIGHTNRSKGACSPFGIPCEFDFNKKVASYLECFADVYEYSTYTAGYTAMVKANAAKMNVHPYKLVIELHYNAATPLANGTEVLYYFASKTGKAYAEVAANMITQKFGTTNRGAKALVKSSDRGFAAVYYPKAPAIMLEPFFGSNIEDANKFKGKEKEYADLIMDFVRALKL